MKALTKFSKARDYLKSLSLEARAMIGKKGVVALRMKISRLSNALHAHETQIKFPQNNLTPRSQEYLNIRREYYETKLRLLEIDKSLSYPCLALDALIKKDIGFNDIASGNIVSGYTRASLREIQENKLANHFCRYGDYWIAYVQTRRTYRSHYGWGSASYINVVSHHLLIRKIETRNRKPYVVKLDNRIDCFRGKWLQRNLDIGLSRGERHENHE